MVVGVVFVLLRDVIKSFVNIQFGDIRFGVSLDKFLDFGPVPFGTLFSNILSSSVSDGWNHQLLLSIIVIFMTNQIFPSSFHTVKEIMVESCAGDFLGWLPSIQVHPRSDPPTTPEFYL